MVLHLFFIEAVLVFSKGGFLNAIIYLAKVALKRH